MNKNLTPKERGLLKGAIRRVFSRSELRKRALLESSVDYVDPNRARVKKWSRCPVCKTLTPTYLMKVDHIDPVIPTNRSFEEMSLDEVVDRMWCSISNLQSLCDSCHDKKTKEEKKLRNQFKKEKRSKENGK